MNVDDRHIMVKAKNVRHLYGGKFEPVIHLVVFIFLLLISYASYGLGMLIDMEGFFTAYFIFLTLPSCLSYFWVARLRDLGEASNEQFNAIRAELIESAGRVKSRGKYYIEIMDGMKRGISRNTHTTIFLYNGRVYASAWKYGTRGWHYLPYFTGEDEIDELRRTKEKY